VLEDYFTARRFQSPFLRATEAVSPLSALWAFLLGPVYYWRKRAPIEALLFAVAMGALLFIDDDWNILGGASDFDLGSVIWLVFALAAPILAARVLPQERLGRGRRGPPAVSGGDPTPPPPPR
jgi:hypothetical protein